jgi:hypothetical protein
LLLMIRPARPTLAEVPLADLSLSNVDDGTPTDARIFDGKLTRRRAANPLLSGSTAAVTTTLWPQNHTLKGFLPWLTALMHWFG